MATITKRDSNGTPYRETIIGHVTLTEPKVFRTTEQTACNWREITVPAGTYDAVLWEQGSLQWVMVRYHGVKTDEHFVNRLFGSSSLAAKRGIGEPATYTTQMYRWTAAERFANEDGWDLAPGFRVTLVERPGRVAYDIEEVS